MLLEKAVSVGLRGMEGSALPSAGHVAEVARMRAVSSLDAYQPGMGARGLVVDAGNTVHRIAYRIWSDVARTFVR